MRPKASESGQRTGGHLGGMGMDGPTVDGSSDLGSRPVTAAEVSSVSRTPRAAEPGRTASPRAAGGAPSEQAARREAGARAPARGPGRRPRVRPRRDGRPARRGRRRVTSSASTPSARRRGSHEPGRVAYVVCDVRHLPFRPGVADLVVSFDVIEHFADDAVPLTAARQLVRDGGVVALTVPALPGAVEHVRRTGRPPSPVHPPDPGGGRSRRPASSPTRRPTSSRGWPRPCGRPATATVSKRTPSRRACSAGRSQPSWRGCAVPSGCCSGGGASRSALRSSPWAGRAARWPAGAAATR